MIVDSVHHRENRFKKLSRTFYFYRESRNPLAVSGHEDENSESEIDVVGFNGSDGAEETSKAESKGVLWDRIWIRN